MGEGGTIPFMAMLGEQLSARAVPDHRRARPEVQRARTQRVPAHRVCEAADRLRGERAGGARDGGLDASRRMPALRGVRVDPRAQRSSAQRAGAMPPQQQPRNVEIERRALRRFDQRRELAVVARSAEPAPVAKHMDVDALAGPRIRARAPGPRPASAESRAAPARRRAARSCDAGRLRRRRRRRRSAAADVQSTVRRRAARAAAAASTSGASAASSRKRRARRCARRERPVACPTGFAQSMPAAATNRGTPSTSFEHAGFGLAAQRAVVRAAAAT